ncbi:hypothetical protein WJX84_001293 [Apatococcus fuscideae]|uniref:Uncharacterized protein n=1 Tax=Apatococcus fuscideae TaxID=2026836 RepID=A0AAW1T478_9CHLO
MQDHISVAAYFRDRSARPAQGMVPFGTQHALLRGRCLASPRATVATRVGAAPSESCCGSDQGSGCLHVSHESGLQHFYSSSKMLAWQKSGKRLLSLLPAFRTAPKLLMQITNR